MWCVAGSLGFDAKEFPVTLFWIALGLAVLGGTLFKIGRSHRPGLRDIGSVSDRWIAEHRSQTGNSPR